MSHNSEIKCPECGTHFKIDDRAYAEILSTVRDQAFEDQLEKRLQLAESEKSLEIAEVEKSKNQEIFKLSSKLEALEEKNEVSKELAIRNALSSSQKEYDQIKNSSKKEIYELKFQLETVKEKNEINKQLAIQEALSPLQNKISNLENSLEKKELEVKVFEKSLIEKHSIEKQGLNDQIASLRDYKSKLSVKLVGENLEQHCLTEFERCLRPILPNATFTKDNDASKGETKGDYIYQENDNNGTEIVSIMFDMKDECDLTATKKKNEDFLAKLDKDRNRKNCEYAVLVSTLEADSDLYNAGIAGKQHLYPKMCVVRPQAFITIINFLREKGLDTLESKTKLENQKAKNLDVTNFENDLEALKIASGKNLELGLKGIQKAIDRQHKIISQAEDTITDLIKTASRNFKLLNNKLQEVTVKKLVSKNPTMKAKFNELENNI